MAFSLQRLFLQPIVYVLRQILLHGTFFFVISPSLRKKRDIVLFLEGNNESLLGAVCRVALYRQC